MTDGLPVRVLFAGSRYWHDPTRVAVALLGAIRWYCAAHLRPGQPAVVTLVHGRCDPRMANNAFAAWDWAITHPGRGPFHGGDWLAHHFALSQGWIVEPHPADWARHGDGAGPIRNREMVATGADVAVGLLLGRSKGTRGCMDLAQAADIPTRLYTGTPVTIRKTIRIRLLGGPNHGALIGWDDTYPPSRWTVKLAGVPYKERRGVYRPIKTAEGVHVVSPDGEHAYQYVGEESL